MSLDRVTLIGAGLMMLVVGALHLAAPQMMMDAPGLRLTSPSHVHVIRAAYGGAYIGIGALFLFGLLRAEHSRTSLVAVAFLFSGFAFGRLVSIVLDGPPVALYLGVLAFEVVFAALAMTALSRGEA